MKSEQQRWWQKNRQALMLAGIVAVVIGGAVLIFAGYLFHWTWTGFFDKTLWDWMQLLIIPAVLTTGAFLFNRAERTSEQAIALDNQQAATLQTYLDRMSELLLEKSLRTSKPDDEVRNVARTQTLTVVRSLDANRKRTVLQFLHESGLISNHEGNSILNLERASLHGVNLHNADLSEANLNRTTLRKANLRNANLHKTSLCRAKLSDANLSEANLSEANLTDAFLEGAKLCNADLSHANLCGADLTGADLRGAIVTPEQLEKAQSLKNIMQ